MVAVRTIRFTNRRAVATVTTTMDTSRPTLRLVAGGVLLGTLGIFVEEAGADPLTTVLCRCVFGAAALAAWAAATGRFDELRLGRRGWAVAALVGVLVAANWALFFAAIGRTSIGVATVVFHVQPLWVMLAGAWWLRERVSIGKLVAVGVALAGLALASGIGGDSGMVDARYLGGIAMCVAGSLSYAAVTLIAKETRVVGSLGLAFGQCVVGAVLLAAWPLLQPPGALPSGTAWAWLAGLGILHTGLAYALLYGAMARLSSERIALLQFVYPAAAIAFDWAVYGRALDVAQWAGVALLAGALLAATPRRPGPASPDRRVPDEPAAAPPR